MVNIQPDEAGDFQGLPFQVVMTVGVDILYQKPLYIDFANKELGFLDGIPPELEAKGRAIGLSFTAGLAFFDLALGSRRLRALFDTGAGYSTLNAKHLEALKDELIEQEPEEVFDTTGTKTTIPVYKHPSLQIGGEIVGDIRFLAIDLAPLEKALDTEIGLIFGFDTMVKRNWVVDKTRQLLLML